MVRINNAQRDKFNNHYATYGIIKNSQGEGWSMSLLARLNYLCGQPPLPEFSRIMWPQFSIWWRRRIMLLMKKTGSTQKDKLKWTTLCLEYLEYKEGIYWIMTPIYEKLMFRCSRWLYNLKRKFSQRYL